MKIIKQGVIPPKKKTCPNCKTKFEYEKSDIYDGSNSSTIHKYVVCPHPDCRKQLTIEHVDLSGYKD